MAEAKTQPNEQQTQEANYLYKVVCGTGFLSHTIFISTNLNLAKKQAEYHKNNAGLQEEHNVRIIMFLQ